MINKKVTLNKLFDGRTIGEAKDGKHTDETGRPTVWRGRLTLSQGGKHKPFREIKATLRSCEGVRILSDGCTKIFPVSAIYADTGQWIRSQKILQEVWDAMMAEVPNCQNVWSDKVTA